MQARRELQACRAFLQINMKRILAIILFLPLALFGQTRLTIGVGNSANDGTGDSLRTAMQKANTNFSTLWATVYTNGVGKLGTSIPLIGNTVIDGGAPTYDFTIQDVDDLSVEGTDTSLTGISTMYLDGADFTIRATTSYKLISPMVYNGNGVQGGALELVDATEGNAEFKVNRVASVAALKALGTNTVQSGGFVATLGYYTAGDGGHGVYRYDSGSSATANDGLVIAPTHGVGRFLLIHSGSVSLAQFGAKGDSGVTDNSTQFAAAVAALNAGSIRKLTVPYGNFYVNGMHSITGSNISIEGIDNAGSSTITGHRTTSGNTSLFRVYGTNTAFVNLGIARSTNNGGTASDAIAYMKFWRLENSVREFTLKGCYINGNASGQIARNGYYYVEIDAFGITSTAGTCPEGIRIQDNFWTDTTSRAIDLNGVRHAIVTGNRFYRCGINNYTGSGNALNPGTCIEFASYDFESPPGTFNTNPSYNITVDNNVFYEWGDGAVNYANVYDSSIMGNVCAGPYTDGVGTALSTINGIALFGGQNVTISGNEMSYLRNFGILVRPQNKSSSSWLHNLRNITISGNVCRAGRAGSTNLPTSIQVYALETNVVTEGVVVTGNSYYGDHDSNTGIAIQCAASSTMRNVLVTGNVLYGGGSSGSGRGIEFTLSGSVSGIAVNNNAIRGFGTGVFNGSNWDNATVAVGNLITDCGTTWSNSGSLGAYSGTSFYSARGAASTTLAQSGAFRMPSQGTITARNNASSGDITLLSSDSSDNVTLAGGVWFANATSGGTGTGTTGKLVLTSASSSVSAGATFNPSGTTHVVTGNGAAVTLSTTTAITAGIASGRVLVLVGGSDSNTVTVPDSGNINVQSARTLGAGDTLVLVWNGSAWCEVSFSNN